MPYGESFTPVCQQRLPRIAGIRRLRQAPRRPWHWSGAFFALYTRTPSFILLQRQGDKNMMTHLLVCFRSTSQNLSSFSGSRWLCHALSLSWGCSFLALHSHSRLCSAFSSQIILHRDYIGYCISTHFDAFRGFDLYHNHNLLGSGSERPTVSATCPVPSPRSSETGRPRRSWCKVCKVQRIFRKASGAFQTDPKLHFLSLPADWSSRIFFVSETLIQQKSWCAYMVSNTHCRICFTNLYKSVQFVSDCLLKMNEIEWVCTV